MFRFPLRRPDLSREDFEAHLRGPHSDLARSLAGDLAVTRWAINFTVDPPPPDFPFEAIEECWFAAPEDAARALRADAMTAVTADLATVSVREREITMLTRPTHRWPKEPKPQ